MKVAFDFDNVLADQGSGRPHRYFVMRELWKSLHATKHQLAIIAYVNPSGKDRVTHASAVAEHKKVIEYAFSHYHLPKPHALVISPVGKLDFLRREKPDLFIDDLASWTSMADEHGITSLRLI